MCLLLTGNPKWTKKINLKVKFTQYIFCQNVEKTGNFSLFEPILSIAEDDKKINNTLYRIMYQLMRDQTKMGQEFNF